MYHLNTYILGKTQTKSLNQTGEKGNLFNKHMISTQYVPGLVIGAMYISKWLKQKEPCSQWDDGLHPCYSKYGPWNRNVSINFSFSFCLLITLVIWERYHLVYMYWTWLWYEWKCIMRFWGPIFLKSLSIIMSQFPYIIFT